MDLVLESADTFFFDRAYATLFPKILTDGLNGTEAVINPSWINYGLRTTDRYGLVPTYLFEPTAWTDASIFGRESMIRQFITLFIVTTVFGWILYFFTASLSYWLIYDKSNLKHPKFLKNQMGMEIHQATTAIPVMTLLTVPWFTAEVQGLGKLYWDVDQMGKSYLLLQFPLFLLFTDCLIYMIHRGLHHKLVYKHLHKPHHKWIVPTPFASHAFHPVDGYLQSLPYHIFPFVFPLHKVAYIALFSIVNVWTVMIHDGEYLAKDPIVNGSACHTIHHLYFNYNYGQYTTLWDRIGRTHRNPEKEMFDKDRKMANKTIATQVQKMEEIQKEVEGDDVRVYVSGSKI